MPRSHELSAVDDERRREKRPDSIILNEDSKHYIVNKPGRPGRSLKIKNVTDCLPKLTIERAVKGMLSKTETKRLMRRLNIYSNQNHSHQAQSLIEVDVSNFRSTSQFINTIK